MIERLRFSPADSPFARVMEPLAWPGVCPVVMCPDVMFPYVMLPDVMLPIVFLLWSCLCCMAVSELAEAVLGLKLNAL